MKITMWKNGVMTERELTPEEIAAMQREATKAQLMERSRPLTVEEVSRMLLIQHVNTLEVDDNTALRMREFYPEWAVDTVYTVGYKVRYKDGLWRVRQDHTSQAGWEPDIVPALWEQVCESHDGTLDDPIPYDGNMALEEGLYYHQDYVIYRCTRDTVVPVYHALRDLVGLYVEQI